MALSPIDHVDDISHNRPISAYLLVHGGFVVVVGTGGTLPNDWRRPGTACLVRQPPSTGPDPATLGDLAAEAAVVRQYVDSIGECVVLVGHSYGGMVMTELADDPGVAHSATPPRPGRGAASMMDMLQAVRR